MPPKDKPSLIRARLILAQKLLEESDTLPGFEGYNFKDPGNWALHERHEREALVVYLLLTCFDLLGQSQKHVDFMKWLTSKKSELVEERRIAAEIIRSENGDCFDQAKFLFEHYNRHHGATSAFYSGIEQLPHSARQRLLSTVSVVGRDPRSLNPEYKNTSFPGIPLEDEEKKITLQKKYLYSLRNAFTHQLSQTHFSSIPLMSAFPSRINLNEELPSNGACWGIYIRKGKITYAGNHSDHTNTYYYSLSDWPFVLFEVLYAALGEKFDRTTIKLKFFIQSFDEECPYFFSSVEHALVSKVLKDHFGISSC
jgi:hypothetical protein